MENYICLCLHLVSDLFEQVSLTSECVNVKRKALTRAGMEWLQNTQQWDAIFLLQSSHISGFVSLDGILRFTGDEEIHKLWVYLHNNVVLKMKVFFCIFKNICIRTTITVHTDQLCKETLHACTNLFILFLHKSRRGHL